MLRIAGVNLPPEKRAEIALTYIYGIGQTLSNQILKKANINPDTRVKDLTQEETNSIKTVIDKEKLPIEGELRRKRSADIQRLKRINCYRGTRHAKHLPTRGQRTKTNCRTVRGNVRITMGSGKRKEEKT
jgi:small subunit ribosomal protein S13